MEIVYQDNPQTVSELEEAIGMEITSIGCEVMKAINDSMKKMAPDYIKSGGHHIEKLLYLRSNRVKFFNLRIVTQPRFYKSVYENLIY